MAIPRSEGSLVDVLLFNSHLVIVTHYFGHSNDDSIGMCLGSQNNLLHEKND
jgi:hypothetical protein